jgi:hypothetical protein
MITDPTNPIATGSEPDGIVGTKSPLITAETSGCTEKKFVKKQVAIVPIKRAKNTYQGE